MVIDRNHFVDQITAHTSELFLLQKVCLWMFCEARLSETVCASQQDCNIFCYTNVKHLYLLSIPQTWLWRSQMISSRPRPPTPSPAPTAPARCWLQMSWGRCPSCHLWVSPFLWIRTSMFGQSVPQAAILGTMSHQMSQNDIYFHSPKNFWYVLLHIWCDMRVF